jgi:hypothetical protein
MAFLRNERVCPNSGFVPSATVLDHGQVQGIPAAVFPQNLIKTGRTAPLTTRCAKNEAPCGTMLAAGFPATALPPARAFVRMHQAVKTNQRSARLV